MSFSETERKNFLHKKVPLWISALTFIATSGGVVAAFIQFRNVVYDYQLTLPENTQQETTYNYGSWPALNNADFYNRTLNKLISQKATFINANLSSMEIQFYKDGAIADKATILSKGKPGSWWETPAGLYKVTEKVRSDFSSFAKVYSPWALVFQGNFLIHGWPYYPNGDPVPPGYSGGCIRLSTDDAKTLYGMVSLGTPVLVSSNNFTTDNFYEQKQSPKISPRSFLAADMKSNFVFAEKNPDEKISIASLTKLMTALVAVEYINIENTIKITPDMIVKTSVPRLKIGKEYSLYDLLQPLLKESSNEAAIAISDFLGQKYFVQLMNQKAAAIGMTNTRFVDPSGSDWGDVSTAHDFFMLAQYLYNNRSFILKMTTKNTDPTVYGPVEFSNLQNFNVFADDPNFIGGKVGMNGSASGTILSVFTEPFLNNTEGTEPGNATDTSPDSATTTITTGAGSERPIVLIILGSEDYSQDAKNLLDWILNAYE